MPNAVDGNENEIFFLLFRTKKKTPQRFPQHFYVSTTHTHTYPPRMIALLIMMVEKSSIFSPSSFASLNGAVLGCACVFVEIEMN